MTGSADSRGALKVWIVVIAGLAVAIGVVVGLGRGPSGSSPGDEPSVRGDRAERRDSGEPDGGDSRSGDASPSATTKLDLTPEELAERPGGPGTPYQLPGDMSKYFKGVKLRTVRPLRFVARYGEDRPGRRTPEEARHRADEARRRFLAGEDPRLLIRELSDMPTGFPPGMLKQWADLPPAEASPVIPIDGGFAVFFGSERSRD
jgi:hypothetical protein